ncbi:porin [Pseudoduganella namucuonensis]|uniref:Outer membrane protein (Porin) n=1 Tax=Pseudoduganella namucuonensis TaxID=1035707 RepID=A0A1I7F124_9BURK|nr:porin [Pseudoduganella namucuonensis]SFU29923.1 Outer membrane protein (porin) [Pseudoduganella namucuonensis]
MKTSALALALAVLTACAGMAQAESNVTIYGVLDAGLIKNSGGTLQVGKGDFNRLGFKGVEDLGGGLKATFRLESRFQPDTGTTEANGQRPLFQGRSVVGLSGAFGAVKIGRDLTAVQDPASDFDPFGFQTVGTLDAVTGNYMSDTSTASSGNRFSNAVFYSTPVVHGFQLNISVASKEPLNGVPIVKSNPYSVAATYGGGPLSAMLGYERATNEDTFLTLNGAYQIGAAKLLTSYSRFQRVNRVHDTNWLVGADIAVATGAVKLGYGQVKPENAGASRQASLGYWHALSKRTMLYTDASRRTGAGSSGTAVDLGIHHTF